MGSVNRNQRVIKKKDRKVRDEGEIWEESMEEVGVNTKIQCIKFSKINKKDYK